MNDFAEGRIFQRHRKKADIIVSGTYTGQMEALEARVVESGSLEERVPWTVIDPSPQNGIFVGVLADVPQGGWYNLQVRSHDYHDVATHGKHKWGVGIFVITSYSIHYTKLYERGLSTSRLHRLSRY